MIIEKQVRQLEKIEPERNWNVIKEQIDKSKIKRYPWKRILGNSLTEEILRLKKEGLTAEQTIKNISNNENIKRFVENTGENKALENIRISVHARFGENNTAHRIDLE